MQQALNLNGNSGEFVVGATTSPLTDAEFTDFRDGVGTLIKADECKQRTFQGSHEPSLHHVIKVKYRKSVFNILKFCI